MPLAPGTRLGRYEIKSSLGAGGMGEVYLAEDTRLDRKIALKILPSEFAEDKDRMSRFVREAKSASALNHPNIITIHEIGETDGTHFIATEYIQGETLRTRLTQHPLDLNAALDVAIQVASALDAAHRAGIIHRDIKPDNVMIRPDGLVKLLDFGIAKLSEQKAAPVDEEAATAIKPHGTSPGLVIGTANYMSPEQAKGRAVDARTDIFSFGIVLYEMLTGKRAFAGENALDVIGAILHKEPPPLKQVLPELPSEIERIVNKTLRKDADERYQTAKDLLLDLKDAKRELEFQDKLERTAAPNREETKTQLLTVPTTDEARPPTSSAEFITGEVKKHKRGVALGSLMLLALLGVGFWFYFLRSTTDNAPIDSIAVLPFQNRSADADTEYLSDGLAESLIYRLSQIPNLKVSPTSSVFRYKGKQTDAKIIANELGVDSVMTGRIVQRGDNLAISVELVDMRNNRLLWGEQYERKMSELLATQREIAAEITNKLQLKLSGEGAQKLAKKYTNNNEAYQLYLQGRFHFAKRTKDDILKGINYFQQAIKLDPNFALAYASIADSYNSMGKNADLPPKEVLPQAKAAATRALEIDPTLAEAHGALADSLALYDWNWAESEREYGKAFQLDPNVSYIHLTHGVSYSAPLGKRDEAVAELKRAVELEPLSLITNAIFGLSYLYAGQNDKALEQGKRTYDLDPNFRFGRQYLGNTYIVLGRYDEAIALAEEGLKTSPLSQEDLVIAGLAYAESGRRREAEQYLDRFKELAKTRYVRTVFTASIYAALGGKDKAFAELEKSFEDKDCFLPRIKLDPFMDPLRNDPRFKNLLKRMNLPE